MFCKVVFIFDYLKYVDVISYCIRLIYVINWMLSESENLEENKKFLGLRYKYCFGKIICLDVIDVI